MLYTLWLPLINVWEGSFLGLPLFSVFFLGLSIICALLVFLYCFTTSKALYSFYFLLVVTAWITSVMQGKDPMLSFYNNFLYATPLLFFILTELVDFDLKKTCRYVQYMTFIAGIVSLLIYYGIIDSTLNYRLSITIVDNTIGLLGLAVSLYSIVTRSNRLFSWLSAIMAIIVLLTGQSRARVVLGLCIAMLTIFYSVLVKKRGKFQSFVVVICVLTIAYIFISINIDTINDYLGFMLGKFESIGTDGSSIYRFEEMKIHIELFLENPLFGIGCGTLNAPYRTRIDNYLYGHNMFTAILAINGMFYFSIFICIYLKILLKSLFSFFKESNPDNFLAFLLMLIMTALSITSAGFSKPTTHILILLVGVILNKQKHIDKDKILNEEKA